MIYDKVTLVMTKDLPGKKGGPLFLTQDGKVLEAPTVWVNSFNEDSTTRKDYAHILVNFLQWLDEEGDEGGAYWELVDQDIVEEYVIYLLEKQEESEDGAPNDNSINKYIGRIESFYKWGRKSGYRHYWDMDFETITVNKVRDQYLLGKGITVEERLIKLRSRQIVVANEREKFVGNDNYQVALKILDDDDPVYKFMAVVTRCTGLRPKDLFSLPYHGTGVNKDIRLYPKEEWDDLGSRELYYEFPSKGKVRSIPFPGDLWRFICEEWMPLRRERAKLYKERTGLPAPNNLLFINKDGLPVTRKMLSDHFQQVAEHPDYKQERFNARMLRHSFATYAMYIFLDKRGWLGRNDLYDAAFDKWLRDRMGHNDIRTTYDYYVHLANAFQGDDLFVELRQSTSELIPRMGLQSMLDKIGQDEEQLEGLQSA